VRVPLGRPRTVVDARLPRSAEREASKIL